MADKMISIELLKEGDGAAFRQLFDEYYQALCLFAVNYLQDDAEAADVVQVCFIKYWDLRQNFNHLAGIRSFLYTAVRNECLNILRNEKRNRKYLEQISGECFFRNTLIEEEAYRIFYQAIEQLPQQTQKVILLALDGHKNANIATELGISENTVHMLKKIAYKKLRTLLRDYFYIISGLIS